MSVRWGPYFLVYLWKPFTGARLYGILPRMPIIARLVVCEAQLIFFTARLSLITRS